MSTPQALGNDAWGCANLNVGLDLRAAAHLVVAINDLEVFAWMCRGGCGDRREHFRRRAEHFTVCVILRRSSASRSSSQPIRCRDEHGHEHVGTTYIVFVTQRCDAVRLPIMTPGWQLVCRNGAAQRKHETPMLIFVTGMMRHSILHVLGQLAQVVVVAMAVVLARHARCRGWRRDCLTGATTRIVRISSIDIINLAPATTTRLMTQMHGPRPPPVCVLTEAARIDMQGSSTHLSPLHLYE